MTIEIPIIPKLPATGECDTCVDANCCFMPQMLEAHLESVREHDTWHYEDVDPGAWDEHSIDLPEFEDGVVVWCPMHAEIPHDDT